VGPQSWFGRGDDYLFYLLPYISHRAILKTKTLILRSQNKRFYLHIAGILMTMSCINFYVRKQTTLKQLSVTNSAALYTICSQDIGVDKDARAVILPLHHRLPFMPRSPLMKPLYRH